MYSKQEIISTLQRLGIQIYSKKSRKGWITISCLSPTHIDDTPSAGIKEGIGAFHCFGCTYKTNLEKIVMERTNCSWKEAQSFIRGSFLPFNNYFVTKKVEKKEVIKKPITLSSLQLIDLNSSNYHYTNLRGFTKEFCQTFNIKHSISHPYIDYFITPIVSKSHNVNSFEARKLLQKEKLEEYYNTSSDTFSNLQSKFKREKSRRKLKFVDFEIFENGEKIFSKELEYLLQAKVLYPPGSNIDNTIFNYDNLLKNQELLVREGLASLPKIFTSVTKNVTATFGSSISDIQLDILKEFSSIILIPDPDFGGTQMVERSLEKNLRFRVLEVLSDDTDRQFVREIKKMKFIKPSDFINKYRVVKK